jgi:hypothetical protein
MKIRVPVIEILALFALVAFIFWQSQPAPNTIRLTTPMKNWSAEQRAEELRKLLTPLPLGKELLISNNWDRTIGKRQRKRQREQE